MKNYCNVLHSWWPEKKQIILIIERNEINIYVEMSD